MSAQGSLWALAGKGGQVQPAAGYPRLRALLASPPFTRPLHRPLLPLDPCAAAAMATLMRVSAVEGR